MLGEVGWKGNEDKLAKRSKNFGGRLCVEIT
jgi:hypothetical protein